VTGNTNHARRILMILTLYVIVIVIVLQVHLRLALLVHLLQARAQVQVHRAHLAALRVLQALQENVITNAEKVDAVMDLAQPQAIHL